MSIEVPEKEITLGVSEPVVLSDSHDLSQFSCGEKSIDDYLSKALTHKKSKSAQIFVICEVGTNIVVGYYSLAAGSVLRENAPGALSRNGPKEIPAIILGRLGVSKKWQGQGIGEDLVRHATFKCIAAQEHIGVRALVVNALSEKVEKFYKRIGFKNLKNVEMALYLSIK